MVKRRLMVALAASGVAAAIPFLPATSSAGGTDEACLVEPVAGPPDPTAPPDSVPVDDDPVDTASPTTEVVADGTPTTEAVVEVEAPPTTEHVEVVDVTPTTEFADAAPTTEVVIVTVDTLPELTTSAGVGALGLRVLGRNVIADPAPPPRQKINFELQFDVTSDGKVSLVLATGTFIPSDPCGLWPGSKLTADLAIPGRYTVTIPKLKGRDCLAKDITVSHRGTPLRHADDRLVDKRRDPYWSITYNDKDEPQIHLWNIPAKDLNNSSLQITLKCTVLAPR